MGRSGVPLGKDDQRGSHKNAFLNVWINKEGQKLGREQKKKRIGTARKKTQLGAQTPGR